jgi:hypothetical protein
LNQTNQTKQTMKTLLCILIITSSAANWYFGYTVGLSCGQSANAKPSPARPVQKPKTKPAKPDWRELDGDSLLPVRDEYADKSREQLESLLLFGNEAVKLNLSRRR